MPITLWRITKAKHADSAFDGEGARRFGGRWNPRGVSAVYLGGSLSLAALETFVHLSADDSALKFVAISIEVPTEIDPSRIAVHELPNKWRSEPPLPATQSIGGDWLRSGASLLLALPSAIVPTESIYLLNPKHPDITRLSIGAPQTFGFDQRMWK